MNDDMKKLKNEMKKNLTNFGKETKKVLKESEVFDSLKKDVGGELNELKKDINLDGLKKTASCGLSGLKDVAKNYKEKKIEEQKAEQRAAQEKAQQDKEKTIAHLKKYKKFYIIGAVIIILFGVYTSYEADLRKINLPLSYKECLAMAPKDIETEFRNAGFTDVISTGEKDISIENADTMKDGEFDCLYIGSSEYDDFTKEDRYDPDSSIDIRYHSYSDEYLDYQKEQERLVAEQKAEEEARAEEAKAEAERNNYLDSLMTGDYQTDLNDILTGAYNKDKYIAFGKRYKNRVITLNANIGSIENHGNYNTRWDILILNGNVGGKTSGPYFKLSDVGLKDLGISGLDKPSFMNVGNNITIQAKISYYDDGQEIMYLTDVSKFSAR